MLGVDPVRSGRLVVVTQIAAPLPLTPSGVGVVEGILAALLVVYGVATPNALANLIEAVVAYAVAMASSRSRKPSVTASPICSAVRLRCSPCS